MGMKPVNYGRPVYKLGRDPRKQIPSKDMPATLAVQVYLAFIGQGQKPGTQQIWYESLLGVGECFGNKRISTFTRDDMAKYIEHLRVKRGNCNNTIITKLKRLKSMFQFFVEDGVLSVNPVQWRRIPRVQRQEIHREPFTFEQYERVLVQIRKSNKPWWESACIIAYHTGLRTVDICQLRWDLDENGKGSKVDFDREILIVYPVKRSGANQRLEIPMEKEVYQHLLELWNLRGDSPFVLPKLEEDYRTRRPESIVARFVGFCRAAGLPDHSFHSFRHGFVTRMINAGIDPIVIGSITGQCREMILRYSHVSNGAKINALQTARQAMFKAKMSEMTQEITESIAPIEPAVGQ